MKKLFLPVISLMIMLTGCGNANITKDATVSENSSQYTFDITEETSEFGINTKDKDFISKLTDNNYYICHNDVFYPLVTYIQSTEDVMDTDKAASYNDMYFFTSDNEHNIPTLYEGDKLYFYSKSNMLNYTLFYRLYDCSYTIGVTNLRSNIGGRYYLDFANEENFKYLLSDSGLEDIYNQKDTDQVMFDKIAGVQITDDLIDNGVIKGLKKDADYDLEVYLGSYFTHYTVKSKYHLFRGYEKFATSNYTTLQDFLYEIEIPEYLKTGYYNLNEIGIFRYVKGNSYNSDTDFNDPILMLPEFDENGDPVSQEKYIYSENPNINKFKTSIPGCVGYVDPELQQEETTNEESEEIVLNKTVMKTYDLFLPANEECVITVKSPTEEKTGNIVITLDDNTQKTAEYDYLNKEYVLTVNGRGYKAVLNINGFTKGYDIELTNAETYRGQDIKQPEEETQVTENQNKGFVEKIKEMINNVLHPDGQGN